jgi:hypothetical protein
VVARGSERRRHKESEHRSFLGRLEKLPLRIRRLKGPRSMNLSLKTSPRKFLVRTSSFLLVDHWHLS